MANKKTLSVLGKVIFRRWVRHWRTGRRIYPVKGKALAFIPRRKRTK